MRRLAAPCRLLEYTYTQWESEEYSQAQTIGPPRWPERERLAINSKSPAPPSPRHDYNINRSSLLQRSTEPISPRFQSLLPVSQIRVEPTDAQIQSASRKVFADLAQLPASSA